MKRLTLGIAVTLLLTISAFSQNSIKVGSAAPLFAATSMDGKAYDLKELRGTVVVVTFWSTSCEICHSEIPNLNHFTERFDSKKVVFLALASENEAKITAYLKHTPFNFQILPNSFGTLFQYADRDKEGYVDMGFPSFFVIDRQGIVQFKTSGYDKTAPLDAAIRKLIAD